MPRKEYICGYKFCMHSGEPVLPENSVKDGGRYYHTDCHKEKETKKQIIDLYYKYYKSTEDYKVVVKAMNSLIHDQNNSATFVLYVLCQCIHDKVPFRGIFSLSWQVKNNMQYKKKYQSLQAKAEVKKYRFDAVPCAKPTATPQCENEKPKGNSKSWEKILFGGG